MSKLSRDLRTAAKLGCKCGDTTQAIRTEESFTRGACGRCVRTCRGGPSTNLDECMRKVHTSLPCECAIGHAKCNISCTCMPGWNLGRHVIISTHSWCTVRSLNLAAITCIRSTVLWQRIPAGQSMHAPHASSLSSRGNKKCLSCIATASERYVAPTGAPRCPYLRWSCVIISASKHRTAGQHSPHLSVRLLLKPHTAC